MFLVAQFISANAFQSAQTRRIERNVQVKAAPTREELSFMLEKFGPTPELVMGIMFDKVSRQLYVLVCCRRSFLSSLMLMF